MGKEHNISKANRQLGDTTFFKRLDQDPTSDLQRLLKEKLTEMLASKKISEDTIEYLTVTNPRTGRPPPQNSQTWQLWIPNCLCKRSPNQMDLRVCCPTLLVSRLPPYVQDTTDYLTKLSSSDIFEETLLV